MTHLKKNLRACPGLYRDRFTFTFTFIVEIQFVSALVQKITLHTVTQTVPKHQTKKITASNWCGCASSETAETNSSMCMQMSYLMPGISDPNESTHQHCWSPFFSAHCVASKDPLEWHFGGGRANIIPSCVPSILSEKSRRYSHTEISDQSSQSCI